MSKPEGTTRFSDAQLQIVRFCAVECEMQQSGERSVHWMLNAWEYAQGIVGGGSFLPPDEDDILILGELVEPFKNQNGFRKVAVRVGWDIKPDWRLVPRQMTNLVTRAVDELSPAEWFRAYEEVHPFVDGNGRTGQILFNWLNNTLDKPEWAPNFWGDPRRKSGDGA